jgi:hypothetical protein
MVLNSRPPTDEEKQMMAMLWFLENVILSATVVILSACEKGISAGVTYL